MLPGEGASIREIGRIYGAKRPPAHHRFRPPLSRSRCCRCSASRSPFLLLSLAFLRAEGTVSGKVDAVFRVGLAFLHGLGVASERWDTSGNGDLFGPMGIGAEEISQNRSKKPLRQLGTVVGLFSAV